VPGEYECVARLPSACVRAFVRIIAAKAKSNQSRRPFRTIQEATVIETRATKVADAKRIMLIGAPPIDVTHM
jgi:hypothetical protein